MYCRRCHEFYQPSVDEEKLLVAGAIPELCTKCATTEWNESVKDKPLSTPVYPGTEYIGDGRELHRVDWYSSGGPIRAFIALPPRPLKQIIDPLRPHKAGQLSVTVMSETERFRNERRPSEPRLQILTNLEHYKEWQPPILWIQKSPDFYDPLTGIGRIEIPAGKVTEVTRIGNQVHVAISDGDMLRLLYR